MSKSWTGLAIVGAMLLFALAVFSSLPPQIPTQWDFSGEPVAWDGRAFGAFLFPLVGLGMWGLAWVLPRIDPRRPNYARFRGTYWLIFNLILGFLAAMEVLTLGAALGWPVPIGITTVIWAGLLLIGIGNYLPRIRSNWWMGIRTPWTLESERVWRETHRVGGWTFTIAGVIVLASLPFPPEMQVWMSGAAIGAAALGSIAFSYFAWRREQKEQTA